MSVLFPFLVLDQTCTQVHAWVNERLADADFRSTETFDLQEARRAHPDCLCPYHGSNDCNCQLIILLIYRKQEDPATLVIHGRDGKTWLSLAEPVGKRANQQLEMVIRRTLTHRHVNEAASIGSVYDARSPV